MGRYPASPISVPALDQTMAERSGEAKAAYHELVANGRKERSEANPDAPGYTGGFPVGHPNAGIIPAYQQTQSDLAISLSNAKKARKSQVR